MDKIDCATEMLTTCALIGTTGPHPSLHDKTCPLCSARGEMRGTFPSFFVFFRVHAGQGGVQLIVCVGSCICSLPLDACQAILRYLFAALPSFSSPLFSSL